MKKIIGFITALILVLTLFAAVPFTANAEGTDFYNATYIQLGQTIYGNTSNGNRYEHDYFKFTIPKDGYVTLNFKNKLQGHSNHTWYLNLYNSDYSQIICEYIYGNYTNFNSRKIGLQAGTYYIMVASAGYRNATSTDTYGVTVNYTPSNYWEKEYNEDFNSATPIKVNSKYYGTTRYGHRDEHDYFKFTIPKDGYVTLNFKNKLQGHSNHTWYLNLYNSDYSQIICEYIYGNYTNFNSRKIGLKAGTYYIMVASAGYRNVASTDTYGVTVNYTPSNYWEKEYNEDFNSATPIKVNSKYYGTTRNGNRYEHDYFKLSITKSGTYKINFATNKNGDSNDLWNIQLFDKSYNIITEFSKSGTVKNKYNILYLAKGTYYICVYSTGSYDAKSFDVYNIAVSYHIPNVENLRASTTTNSIKLKWNKSSGADYYLVQKYNRNTGKYVTIANTATNSYTNKSLSLGTNYRYRVRAYKVVNNKKIYSSKYTYLSATTEKYKAKSIKLSSTSYTYNGKVRTPKVTVIGKDGKKLSTKYYSVTYQKGRKNVGKYKVTVKMKGKYSGRKTLYFKIKPKKL